MKTDVLENSISPSSYSSVKSNGVSQSELSKEVTDKNLNDQEGKEGHISHPTNEQREEDSRASTAKPNSNQTKQGLVLQKEENLSQKGVKVVCPSESSFSVEFEEYLHRILFHQIFQ